MSMTADYVIIGEMLVAGAVRREYMIKDNTVLDNLPDDSAVGSVAYTADLTFMAQFDGDEWVTVGGEGS